MKPLTYYLDTQAVDALCDRYGQKLQGMSVNSRLGIVAALTSAAQSVALTGVSESLDLLFCESFADIPASGDEAVERQEIPEYLAQLDGELDNWQQATALAAGIAEGLAYASV